MGTWTQFRCSGCGYEAEVSGGEDVGMAAYTSTITCLACRRLYDVLTAYHTGGQIERRVEPRCPRSSGHRIEPWRAPGPCPRCGDTMEQGEATVMWD